MNEYMKGHIDCCEKLFSSARDFKEAVKRSTGLTESGFKSDNTLMAIYRGKKK